MAEITIQGFGSCDSNGGLISGSWASNKNQSATVTLFGTGTAFTDTRTFTGAGSGTFTFSGLSDDLYEISVTGSIDGASEIVEILINCGPLPVECDLVINTVTTVAATNGLNNGRATINATGTGTMEYSLDNINWQTSPVFTTRPVGVYTAYARKQNQLSCGAEFDFQISAAPVLGCTNPDALNYNPAATTDNGSCQYLTKFYACGGVLPNPVFIGVNFPVAFNGVAKANHYAKVNIYKNGETTPFATAQQTLRNGSAQIDISSYLKNQFTNAYQEPTAQVIYRDEQQSFGFYVGIIEYYNGSAQPEVLRTQPPRVAVNAALPEYNDSLEPYLIKGTTLITDNPSQNA